MPRHPCDEIKEPLRKAILKQLGLSQYIGPIKKVNDMRETVEIMRYPVTLTPAPEGGYMVSFVDIPEALTQGETVAEAMLQKRQKMLY